MFEEKRQRTAILFADISGYTALMQEDELRAGHLLAKFQQATNEQTAKFDGKIINFYGDGCLIIFEDPVNALKCAGSLQMIFQKNPKVPVRIGLHIGNVLFSQGNVFGDSVNITSRIESIGIPGAVLFSEAFKEAIEHDKQFQIAFIGSFNFKNIKSTTKIYALANQGFVIPQKRNLRGKLQSKPKSPIKKAIEKAKTALAVLGVFTLLVIINFDPIKNHLSAAWGGTSLKDKKVAVMSFDNETGNEQLNSIGKMASDWITQQLQEIEGTKVVLSANVHNNMHLAKASMEGMQTFAKATGASVIIKGRYYLSGEDLILQAQVYDPKTGEVIHTLEKPIIGNKNNPLPLIQDLSQRITGFWAVQGQKQFSDRPPKLPAYQAYLEGRKYAGIDFEKVEKYFSEAYRLDTTFIVPLVELIDSKINESAFQEADSLLAFVEHRSKYLSKAHRLKTRAYTAQLEGNLQKSLSYWEEIYDIDSKEFTNALNLSRQYLNNNQVKKALNILKNYDLTYINFKECEPCQEYYELLTYAHFQSGHFQEVISIVDKFDFTIREGLIANYYIKSLVHVGDFDKTYDKLGEFLGEDLTFNGGRQSSGLLLVGLLFELQKQNKPDIAKVVATLLINYGEENYQDWLSNYYLGMGYYAKQDYEDAAEHFQSFYNDFKNVPIIIDLGLGSLAASYIQLKDFNQLDKIYEELNSIQSPYSKSHIQYTFAKIEAQLGNTDKALNLLKKSKKAGQTFLWFSFQNDPLLQPLHEETAFLDWING
jgi:TolB-like protein/tetratricopeptide (TPR) repeat protein